MKSVCAPLHGSSSVSYDGHGLFEWEMLVMVMKSVLWRGFQAVCQDRTPAVSSSAVLHHSGDVSVFVRCHVEVLLAPPNEHRNYWFSHSRLITVCFCLCSLKALVSTGGKNVQAACDWWAHVQTPTDSHRLNLKLNFSLKQCIKYMLT